MKDYVKDYMDNQEETEEIEMQVFTMEYEDGSSAECGILAVFSIEFEDTGRSQDYCAVIEVGEDAALPEELEVMLFRYYEDPLDENASSWATSNPTRRERSSRPPLSRSWRMKRRSKSLRTFEILYHK